MSSIEKRSARASTCRDSWLEIIVVSGTISAIASATAGTGDVAPRRIIASPSRATASMPNGVTISR